MQETYRLIIFLLYIILSFLVVDSIDCLSNLSKSRWLYLLSHQERIEVLVWQASTTTTVGLATK